MIYRGTTPTIRLHILNADYDLNSLTDVAITMCNDSGRNLKSFTNCTIDNEEKKISVRLSHDESLEFETGYLLVQLTATLNGEEMGSPILRTEVGQNLRYMV